MWKSIWKWIKRILFIITMLTCIVCSIVMFSDSIGTLNVFLGILVIVLALANCVLYFIFNETKKWPIIVALVLLIALSIFLSISVEASIYPICIICSVLGVFISCGFKWVTKFNNFLGGKK